jgi:hypothetical protein
MAREYRRRFRPWKPGSPEPDWNAILAQPPSDPRNHRFARELGPDFEALLDEDREAWFRDDFKRRGVRANDWRAYAAELSRVYRTKIEPFEGVDYESRCYEFAAVYLWKNKAYNDKLRRRGRPKVVVSRQERAEIERLDTHFR